MKILSLIALASISTFTMKSADNLIMLNLQQSTTSLQFNPDTGAWTDTYDDDQTTIESQCFSFVHNSISDWQTWWGFTASNSANNSYRDNFITYQFSNMAEGGILLNEDGSIMTNETGAPISGPEMPYLVGYYSPYMSARPVDMTFNTGKSYRAVGVYVNLNSYVYYAVENGLTPARAFTDKDHLTLTIHGVTPQGDTNEVIVSTASYNNGDLTINRGWKYVDLTTLGTIDELYFTVETTDSGVYGANTPQYFCLDKLMVEDATVGMETFADGSATIAYDRSEKSIRLSKPSFVQVYNTSGRCIMSIEDQYFSIAHLEPGVYVIRSGNSQLKVAR